jgi:two-component system, NtrC family, response regulator HydG
MIIVIIMGKALSTRRFSAPEETLVDCTRPHVLVIDDEEDVRELLVCELDQDGFDVTCASTGMAAVEMLKACRFDVAVCDFRMPGINGAETVARIKVVEPDLKVIIATGYATTSSAIQCMKSGAYDFIEKPYNVRDLKQMLHAALFKTQLDAMAALHGASAALVKAISRPDFLQSAVNWAATVVPCSTAALLLAQAAGAAAVRKAPGAESLSDEFLREVTGKGLHSSEPLRMPIPGLIYKKGDASGESVGCALTSPLRVCGRSFGALTLMREPGLPVFTTPEGQAIRIFATEVALALETMRLRAGLGVDAVMQ